MKNDGMNFCPVGCSASRPVPWKDKCPAPLVRTPIKTPIADTIKNAPNNG